MLLNLLSNAVKFSDGPGEIEVSCEGADAVVRIRVRDTGIGIPADRLEKIFEPFVQVDTRLARSREGTELGLAISRDLARGMGGEVVAQSELGVGSTLTLTLPSGVDQQQPDRGVDRSASAGLLKAARAALLEQEGVHAVLETLNRRTTHRFTGLYRLDASVLRNVALFDREAPHERRGADAALRETYCSIVGVTGSFFASPDTGADERVADHPARGAVVSYCGVLVRDEQGHPIGTLCHFDVRQQPVPADEIPLMEAVAPLLAEVVIGAGTGEA